jgi:hypothetical protein
MGVVWATVIMPLLEFRTLLERVTRKPLPHERAQIEMKWVVACQPRVLGNGASNLERAAACVTNAAQALTPEAIKYESSVVRRNIKISFTRRAAVVSPRARERMGQ